MKPPNYCSSVFCSKHFFGGPGHPAAPQSLWWLYVRRISCQTLERNTACIHLHESYLKYVPFRLFKCRFSWNKNSLVQMIFQLGCTVNCSWKVKGKWCLWVPCLVQNLLHWCSFKNHLVYSVHVFLGIQLVSVSVFKPFKWQTQHVMCWAIAYQLRPEPPLRRLVWSESTWRVWSS